MQPIKNMVYETAPELYRAVWQYAVETLHLPYMVDYTLIGFGKLTNFHMFWLSARDGRVYFNARRTFCEMRGENMVRIPFSPTYEKEIFEAIDAIYANYQAGEAAWMCEAFSKKTSDVSFLTEEVQALDDALVILKAHIEQMGDREIISPRVGTRAFHVLRENGVFTDADLVAFGAKRLAACKNCGKKTIERITEFVLLRTSFDRVDDTIPLHLQHAEIWYNITDKLKGGISDNTLLILADGETLGLYEEMGHRFVETFQSIMTHIIPSARVNHSYTILSRYAQDDTITLGSLAHSSGLSKEGARQQVQKGKQRCRDLFHQHLKTKNRVFHQLLSNLVEIFDVVGCDNIIPFVFHGLGHLSFRRREMMFSILFSPTLSEALIKGVKAYASRVETTEDTDIPSWDFYTKKIFFPTARTSKIPADLPTYDSFLEYDYEQSLLEKLQNLPPFIRVVSHPDIPFDGHRPDILLVLPDERGVLVMVAPTLSLALYYNVCKMNALHAFCRENGYGYLILDDEGRSIFELRRLPLEDALRENLLAILREAGQITWQDIKTLRKSHLLSNDHIAAFVLSEKLHLTINPFSISPRPL